MGLMGLMMASETVSSPADSKSQHPELILHSGKILTVNLDFEVVEALAIRKGIIVGVGSNDEVKALAGVKTKIIDLEGKSVIPGFIDSHSHPTVFGMHIIWPDLSNSETIKDILDTVAVRVKSSQPGQWITNSRIWNEEKLAERRNPTRWDLDSVSPNNPVFLSRGHLGVANTAAFNVLGISKDTPDPPGGHYERAENTGELTGRIYETAMDDFRQALPRLTLDQIMAAQRASQSEMAAAGITGIRSAGFGAGDGGSGAIGADELRGFLELKLRGELTLRTSVTIRIDPNQPAERLEQLFREAPVASGFGDEMLSIWGIKMVADGGTDLAYLRQEYKNRPGFRGQLGGTFENFVNATKLSRQYGWRVATHALGDAALDFVLDVYEAVNEKQSILDKRWAIEHGYFLRPEHYSRIKKLGLIMHPQTWHLYNIHRNFVANYADEYAGMTHPYRTLLEHDIPISGGMDWPIVNPSDVFFYLWVAISRQNLDGGEVAVEQKLNREEALRFHTIWAAYSTFEENKKGSLETGKYADLVVLSEDYLSVSLQEIKKIRPLLTVVGGKVIFQEGPHW